MLRLGPLARSLEAKDSSMTPVGVASRPPTIFAASIRLPTMDAHVGLPPPAHLTMPANASSFTEIVGVNARGWASSSVAKCGMQPRPKTSLQDVLLEFYAATDALEQAGAWLFRVARNRIIDRARKKKEEPLPAATMRTAAVGSKRTCPTLPRAPMRPMRARSCSAPYKPRCKRCHLSSATCSWRTRSKAFRSPTCPQRWRVPQNTLLARKRYAVLTLRARLRAEYGDLVI
jgi:hypothetical protein